MTLRGGARGSLFRFFIVCISQTKKWEVFPSFGFFFGLNIPDSFCHRFERRKPQFYSNFVIILEIVWHLFFHLTLILPEILATASTLCGFYSEPFF